MSGDRNEMERKKAEWDKANPSKVQDTLKRSEFFVDSPL